MTAFLAGTEVTLSVPLVDADGVALDASAVQYRLSTLDGAELLTLADMPSFGHGNVEALVVVPAPLNALPNGVTRDLRLIELHCLVGTNITIVRAEYVIEAISVLVVGLNSFQSLSQAQFNARLIPNMHGWDASTPEQQTAALVDARLHICQLSFDNIYDDNRNVIRDTFWANADMSALSPEAFARLPAAFRAALGRAQLAEADAILGGDPVEIKRRAGLLQDNVGESRQTYRLGKPLDLPCSRRALSYLSRYVTFAKRIGRS